MLHNDFSALQKANEIIRAKGIEAVAADCYWIRNGESEEGEDIYCYSVAYDDGRRSMPGWDAPLFKRNGELSDFVFPVLA